MSESREQLAAYAHTAWSGWMRYLFQHGTRNPDGTFTINADKVARWTRQMNTSFAALPHQEQLSDYAEADLMLRIVEEAGHAQ